MKIAVIGSTMMDIVSYTDEMPKAGETRKVSDFHIASGGKGANQAVAAAKLGADVVFLTAIGDDLFGQQSLTNFNRHNLDTSLVTIPKGSSNGIASIIVDNSGQNRILINPGANELLTPEHIDAAADTLKTCGLIILQLEVPLPTVYAAINFAKANNIKVLLNPAPATKELSLEMACKCDYFMPNETELSILTGKPTDTLEEVKIAAKELLDNGIENVIVTMGHRGSLLMNKDEETIVPTLKVEAVDSTGAGDSFIGCFAETIARTGNVKEAMNRASKYAALGVTRPGTQEAYATAPEFEKFLKTL